MQDLTVPRRERLLSMMVSNDLTSLVTVPSIVSPALDCAMVEQVVVEVYPNDRLLVPPVAEVVQLEQEAVLDSMEEVLLVLAHLLAVRGPMNGVLHLVQGSE